jgi:hypothetical protein
VKDVCLKAKRLRSREKNSRSGTKSGEKRGLKGSEKIATKVGGVGSNQEDSMGVFGFEDHATDGTINSVKLRVYGRADTSNPSEQFFTVYLWDGSSWIWLISFRDEASYVWKEVDVTQCLNTWAKINQAKIYLKTETIGKTGGGHACDAAVLVVDYS